MKKIIYAFVIIVALVISVLTIKTYAQDQPDIIMSTDDASGGGGSSDDCNLCKVKNIWGIVKFSCKSTPRINKCTTFEGNSHISCDNASSC